jgi:2-amino-4-hydroxy-6-hydroxymethyldihydropteridine diphosphokinase
LFVPEMILIGVGANVAGRRAPTPQRACEAAIPDLAARGVVVERRSRWYRSAPVPRSAQPWFVNGVLSVATAIGDPVSLLAVLLSIERDFGRRRSIPNAPRPLDLDLLDYRGKVLRRHSLVLPHPRLHERAFVLLPLAEVAPHWRHPLSGLPIDRLISRLPPGQPAFPME